ncbi:MAG TPA: PilZ domain-containing protein [Candidatus Sulfotelmatobacter sp.]
MTLQALLFSADDAASDVLGRVLPSLGIAGERSSDLETAIARIEQQKFDALLVDFENPEAAETIIEQARRLGSGHPPLTVALVSDTSRVREILSGGAQFVLYKPISEQKARAGLRAASAMLSRERRRAYRVPVQAPVELTLPDTRHIEAILLDLSETGMDILTSEAQCPGALVEFRFLLPDGSLEIAAHGQVAWANPNGQTGVHFIDIPEDIREELREWLKTAATTAGAGPNETVAHCQLTDLSLGGCYLKTDAPFPERSLIDLCLKTEEMEVHTEGMVRVAHPSYGMGIEFPSRTEEQRQQVTELINSLRSSPETMLALNVSPRALLADLTQFEHPGQHLSESANEAADEMDDPLLDLLRRGAMLQQDDFLAELGRQRTPEELTSR